MAGWIEWVFEVKEVQDHLGEDPSRSASVLLPFCFPQCGPRDTANGCLYEQLHAMPAINLASASLIPYGDCNGHGAEHAKVTKRYMVAMCMTSQSQTLRVRGS